MAAGDSMTAKIDLVQNYGVPAPSKTSMVQHSHPVVAAHPLTRAEVFVLAGGLTAWGPHRRFNEASVPIL